jgi:hypothetical protein
MLFKFLNVNRFIKFIQNNDYTESEKNNTESKVNNPDSKQIIENTFNKIRLIKKYIHNIFSSSIIKNNFKKNTKTHKLNGYSSSNSSSNSNSNNMSRKRKSIIIINFNSHH